jgi:hypothetical protein
LNRVLALFALTGDWPFSKQPVRPVIQPLREHNGLDQRQDFRRHAAASLPVSRLYARGWTFGGLKR